MLINMTDQINKESEKTSEEILKDEKINLNDDEYGTKIKKIVLSAFYNKDTGLTRNIAKLKDKNPELKGISNENIRSILDNYSDTYQENKPYKEIKKYLSYKADYIGQLIHCDLMFIRSPKNTTQYIEINDTDNDLGNGDNKFYRYILVCVDTYSRFLWCYPLKTKSADGVTEKLKDMIKMIRNDFYEGYDELTFRVLTDAGLEFVKRKIESIKNVIHIISKNQHGAVIAENAIYQIRNKIRYYDHSKTGIKKITLDELNTLVNNINNDGPNDIFNGIKDADDDKLYKSIKNNIVIQAFNQGDYVRIPNYRKLGEVFVKKSSVNNYSDRVFIVLYVNYNNSQRIYTYTLGTIDGDYILDHIFYTEQLIKVPHTYMMSINPEKELKFNIEEIKIFKPIKSDKK